MQLHTRSNWTTLTLNQFHLLFPLLLSTCAVMDPYESRELQLNQAVTAKSVIEVVAFTTCYNAELRKQAYTSLVKVFESAYPSRVSLVRSIAHESNDDVLNYVKNNLFYDWHRKSGWDLIEFLKPFDVIEDQKALEIFFELYFETIHEVYNLMGEWVTKFNRNLKNLKKPEPSKGKKPMTDVVFAWFLLARFCANRNPTKQDVETQLNTRNGKSVGFNVSTNFEKYDKLIRTSISNPLTQHEQQRTDELDTAPDSVKARKRFIFDCLVQVGNYMEFNRDVWRTLRPSMHKLNGRVAGTFEPIFGSEHKWTKYLVNCELVFRLLATFQQDPKKIFKEFEKVYQEKSRGPNCYVEQLLYMCIGYFSSTDYRVPAMSKLLAHLILPNIQSEDPKIAALAIRALARFYRSSADSIQRNILQLTLGTVLENELSLVHLEELIDIVCMYRTTDFNLPSYLDNEESYNDVLSELAGVPIWDELRADLHNVSLEGILDSFLMKVIKMKLKGYNKPEMTIKGVVRLQRTGLYQEKLTPILPQLLMMYFCDRVEKATRIELKHLLIRYMANYQIAEFVNLITNKKKLFPLIEKIFDFAFAVGTMEQNIDFVESLLNSVTNKCGAEVILKFIASLKLRNFYYCTLHHWYEQIDLLRNTDSFMMGLDTETKVTLNTLIAKLVEAIGLGGVMLEQMFDQLEFVTMETNDQQEILVVRVKQELEN